MPAAQPVPSASGYLAVDGGQLYYETFGRGHPVVLLHAGIANLRLWDVQVPALAERYHVIRYDLRGFGRSSLPAAPFSHLADLLALFDTLRLERAHLVGASKGAALCLDFALTQPGRVSALVLAGGWPGGFTGTGYTPPQAQALDLALAAGDLDRAAELETQIWFDGVGRAPGQVDGALRERVRGWDRRILEHDEANSRLEQRPAFKAVERLGAVEAPALVIAGALDDPDFVLAAAHLAARLPAARRVLLPGTAHLPNLELPGVFNQLLLDFFASL